MLLINTSNTWINMVNTERRTMDIQIYTYDLKAYLHNDINNRLHEEWRIQFLLGYAGLNKSRVFLAQ